MLIIREAGIADAASISRLISALADHFITPDFAAEGRRELLASMTPRMIAGYLQSGYRYHVAEEGGELVAVVGMREHSHLYHLFVAETRQRQGLAMRLWKTASEDAQRRGNPGVFTVNSSLHALPFYERLGFVAQSGPVTVKGVCFVPMKLELSAS